jgi:sulfatase maturation enzyme AslB (radical SAM superfamily)
MAARRPTWLGVRCNAFRLPVPWQKLVSNNLEINKLDASYFDKYNQLVQICLDTSANTHCM